MKLDAAPDQPPRFWVTVAEPLRLWSSDTAHPRDLVWRYRKTGWLWLVAASQRGRPLQRARLAALLWPQANASQARANLRVLVSDLQSSWRLAGLPPIWQVQRDTLTLLPDERVVTELDTAETAALVRPPPGWLLQLRSRDPQRWGDVLPIDVHDELLGMLQATRGRLQHMPVLSPEYAEQAGALNEGRAPGTEAPTMPGAEAEPALVDVEPGVHHLVLWRIEPAWDLDDTEPAPLWDTLGGDARSTGARDQWFSACAKVTSRMAALGAVVTESDAWGMTLVLGMGSVHASQRWRALESMHQADAYFRMQGVPVRMAAVEGRHALVREDGEWTVAGWRLRLLEALALWAEPGTLACPGSWVDLLGSCTGLSVQSVKFRDLTDAVEVCSVPLAALSASLLPVGMGPAAPLFVGREQLMRQIVDHVYDRPPGGAPLEIWLRAPLGYGKTRLAAEVATRVAQKGGQLWWVAAQPELRNHAWRAVHQTLVRHLPAPLVDQGLGGALDSWGVALEESQALALQQFVRLGTVGQGDLDSLATALARWWSAADEPATAASGLLVVDDVQWLDAASLLLLQRVLACAPSLLCLVLERTEDASVAPTIASLGDANHRMVHTLQPLSDKDARDLLASLPRQRPQTEEEIHRRIAQGQGIPLFLLPAPAAADEGLLPGVAEHCEAWINQLQHHRPVLRLAARLGLRFALRDLVMLGDEGKALAALGHATRLGLLAPREVGYLAFFHPALRDHLLASCTPAQTAQDSAACARHVAAQGDDARAADLWQQAGDIPKARSALLSALELAADRNDLHAAVSLAQRLRDLGYPPGRPGLRARVLQIRFLLMRHGYAHPLAHRIADELAADLRDSKDALLDAEMGFETTALLYLRESGRSQRAALRIGQQMLSQAPSAAARMTAHWAMANVYFWMGDFAQALPWFEEVLGQGDRLSRSERQRYFPSDPLVFCLLQWSLAQVMLGHETSAQTAFERARGLAAAPDASIQDGVIVDVFGMLLADYGAHASARREHVARALERAQAEGFEFWAAFAGCFHALQSALDGQAVEPAGLFACHQAVEQNYPSAAPLAGWLSARALQAAGEPELAFQLINAALDRMRSDGGSLFWADALWLHAQLLDERSQPERAYASRQLAVAHAQRHQWTGWLQRHQHHGL
jgi:tetratricopeptide (TPR) repeat protein